jgi:spore germination protein YaaH
VSLSRRPTTHTTTHSQDGDVFACVAQLVSGARTGAHVVQRGETLTSIAAKYNTTVGMLQKLNMIKDPHVIRVGATLMYQRGAQ